MGIRFEWDATKARTNIAKHRVSFETAVRVFADPFAMSCQDRFEGGEFRWQTLGLVDGCVVLLVAHTVGQDTDGAELVRIISARRASSMERKRYDENRAV